MASHVLDLINTARDSWEASERTGLPITSVDSDTLELVTSLYTGKAFKATPIQRPSAAQSNVSSAPQGYYRNIFAHCCQNIRFLKLSYS